MHNGVDLDVYFEIIIYPVAALFIIEMISRAAKIPNWIKSSCSSRGLPRIWNRVPLHACAHWLTAGVLLALAIALLYQAKVSKLNPQKALY